VLFRSLAASLLFPLRPGGIYLDGCAGVGGKTTLLLQNAKEANAKEIFSKVFTLFLLASSIIWIVLTLFVDDFARIEFYKNKSIIGKEFLSGLPIVPLVLLGYLFNGVYYVFQAGIYIEEKTKYFPIVTFAGAIVNVIVNILLIPIFGIMGAAFATFAAYFVMAVSLYFFSQKFYPINYEFKKVGIILTLVFTSCAAYYYIYFNFGINILFKIIMLIIFFSTLYFSKVVDKNEMGELVIKGLYIGDDYDCFKLAAQLSLKVNFVMLEKPLNKVVVYLDPHEFKSTWLGNKSVYRTRMAIADGGELIVLAPGLKEFGEDREIDRLIRKYGYKTTPEILQFVNDNDELKNNLSAAAHLIHGSSENRFTITYCPGSLSKEEIENVNFKYADLNTMMNKYNPGKLSDGYNTMPDGEEIFFISNPALGLWAHKDRFNN